MHTLVSNALLALLLAMEKIVAHVYVHTGGGEQKYSLTQPSVQFDNNSSRVDEYQEPVSSLTRVIPYQNPPSDYTQASSNI